MLTLSNIKKTYKVGDEEIHALKGVSLSFRQAEFVSVLGPSGCGKTTLMNIIGGLDNDRKGDLFIDGKSTKNYKDKEWDNYRNKKVGFIFQNYYLIPHLSIVANVELSLTIAGISKEERTKRAIEALKRVGLEDQLKKKPNQLSGGQMQRVSIARALVNEPEIILADEPTGALDTKTSKQILDLLNDISKEKLIVMVTHNAELADEYSTRIIRMLDGVVTEDSMPFDAKEAKKEAKTVQKPEETSKSKDKDVKKPKKEVSKMSFFTALSLSFKNLLTKKKRTLLTSFAGSIGIIGIAIVLALSSGMNSYIAKMQADSLSSTPITISSVAVDIDGMIDASQNNNNNQDKFPEGDEVLPGNSLRAMQIVRNKITQEYVDYLKTNIDPLWINDMMFSTGVSMNLYSEKYGKGTFSTMGTSSFNVLLDINFIKTQYNKLEGEWPTNKNEMVLIVDEYNRVPEAVLIQLGLKAAGDETVIKFSDVLGKEYKLVSNDELFELDGSGTKFNERADASINFSLCETLKITAILRTNQETTMGAFSSSSGGVGYFRELEEFVVEQNKNSEIVMWMKEAGNELLNPLKGTSYIPDMQGNTSQDQWNSDLRKFGGEELPNSIRIYPLNFETKTKVLQVLDGWNANHDEKIKYSDMSQLVGDMITSLVDIISYVLIGFTAISLLVSGVMIAIITYISIIERTKEIGILRSIGARKKDVTRVFNAETFIIGLTAGILGVGLAFLITIPANMIIGSLTGIYGIASLQILDALILVVVSVVITVGFGFLPARGAAKKDPVLALRSE